MEQAGKEGWGFPARDQWPEGTVPYKDRALQTPFIQADDYTWIRLPRPDIPGTIGFNFVVKVRRFSTAFLSWSSCAVVTQVKAPCC